MKVPGLDLDIANIYCFGRNYAAHAKELGNTVPKEPIVFLKPTSSVITSGQNIVLPSQSEDVHHEVEVVVAIGRAMTKVKAEEALSGIAGYGIGIDVTARDIQNRLKDKGKPWALAKGFDTFCPLGPFVTADKVANPQDLEISLSVNGDLRQQAQTSHMVFSIAELIAWLSQAMTLQPGDLIFTGTPEGVAAMKSGDHVVAELKGLSKIEVGVA